ncbi:MAG: C1 family peptidase [Lachnospiraceae bacterium]|nr:C1 family peptidase [Lachnospiraceae bacterium]
MQLPPCRLRRSWRAGETTEQLRAQKDAMLSEVYRMLCICLGRPPKMFDFEYRDKNGEFHRDTNLTPQEFYKKYIGIPLNEYISVINAPTENKPYYRSYTVQCLGNVTEGRPVKYVNLPIDELKKAAIRQQQDEEPVWFGCDSEQSTCREGMMDTDLYDLEDLFDMSFPMTKAERLTYRESLMDHAMVLQGVNLDEKGNPNSWRVENSWGEEAGRDGFYVMSDRWFDEFTYQIVVNRKYLSEEALAAYDSEPILLEPWDPMGSLA